MNHVRSIPRSDFKIGMTSDRNIENTFLYESIKLWNIVKLR